MKLAVESLAQGGDGLARHPDSGEVIFVPGGLPGDEFEVTLAKRRKVLRARVVRRLKDSPHRQTAVCDSRPKCGGCSWQELVVEQAMAWKGRLLVGSLSRFARQNPKDLEMLLEPIPVKHRGRHRVMMRVDPSGRLAYHQAASHDLVVPAACPALHPRLESVARGLEQIAPLLQGQIVEVAMGLDGSGESRAVRLHPRPRRRGEATPMTRQGLKSLAQTIVNRGIAEGAWAESEDGQLVVSGNVELGGHLAGDPRFTVRAGLFYQADPAVNASMGTELLRMVNPRKGLRVLDMHAGAGNFALALALARCRVQASEVDAEAFQDLSRNAKRLGQGARLEPLRMTAAQALSRASQRRPPAVVVFDGPRGGDREGAQAIARFQPPKVVAFGCDRVTFARDLAEMGLGTRYALHRVGYWDAFPWTHHLEAFALLELKGA
ncbi:MAG: RsmD family RNA methyltransferase [Myxococcota bacterium]|nr:RsmD family RNA methyltransferase [Myxococcota bacterium]